MKILFVICTVTLVGLTVLAVETLPERRSDVPLLWWTTGNSSARVLQINSFEEWMVRKGYGAVDMELDSNNHGMMKIIIQSVSGVGSDVLEVWSGAGMRELVSAGVLLDVTDLAVEYGFGLDKTYASVREEIAIDGRQYMFPANLGGWVLTINRGLLERENLPLPKFDWTWDEFLQWCLAVRKVDKNGRVTRYAVMRMDRLELYIGNGGSVFNETMTRCTLDSPQVLEVMRFHHDLVFKYKVMPSRVAMSAVPVQAGGFGIFTQWMTDERVVAAGFGRFGLIQLRHFKDFKPDVTLFPHKVMPMSTMYARSAGINAGASNPRLAGRLLQYLAEDTYNRTVVNDTDGLPPNPESAKTAEFLTPSDYPNEHGAHEKYYRAAAEYGVGAEYSRFVNPNVVERILLKYESGLDSLALSIEDAARKTTDEVNLELRHTVERDVKLQPAYEKACALQREIDQLKKEGRPVPIEWISNPVLRRLREAGK